MQPLLHKTITVLVFCISFVFGDFYGPIYPFPTDLSSNDSHVKNVWRNLTETFDAYYQHGKNTSATFGLLGTENMTFSAGLFSLQDEGTTQLQYHHTSPEIASSGNGANKVNGDSIYRAASITKLMTVLVGLIELPKTDWHRPVTEFVPEFTSGEQQESAPQWDRITPWLLANHLAGLELTAIGTDYIYQWAAEAEVANTSFSDRVLSNGLPLIDPEQAIGPCTLTLETGCSQADFIAEIKSRAPAFLPNTTPAYSNLGMMILGLVISRATNKPYDVLYNEAIFKPLEMESSFINTPNEVESLLDRSVIIPGEAGTAQWFSPPNSPLVPSGGSFSTINDLSKFGIGLLNSTLLPKETTRTWMRPHSLTASLSYAMGAPWEIIRYAHKDTGKITDLYTKSGDSGYYGGVVVVIPEYDAGFTFLNAWSDMEARSKAAWVVIDHIAEALIPALESQAAAEAAMKLTGTYTSTDADVNSTVVVSFNESTIPGSESGLSISKWISNSTDMLATHYKGEKPRLLLTTPKQAAGAGKVVFQITINPQMPTYAAAELGPFTGMYGSNGDLFSYEAPGRYAGGAIGKFRFEVDDEGSAICVAEDATRLTMKREQ